MGNAPLPPGTADGFLAGSRPGTALPGSIVIEPRAGINIPVKPAQLIPVIPGPGAGVAAVSGADNGAAGHIAGAPGTANAGGSGGQQFLPLGQAGVRLVAALGRMRNRVCSPVERPTGSRLRRGSTDRHIPGTRLTVTRSSGISPRRANQGAGLTALLRIGQTGIGVRVAAADGNPLDALNPPLFLGKLKNAVNADPGNAGFPVGQPALLGGDETPETAALSEIDRIIPLVAVFAGGPGFGFAESVGLVDAAVEGLAPVFGRGFQDGRSPVGVGKGLPIGTVPRDRPGLGRWIPPPLRKTPLERQGRPPHCVGTWQFPRG